MPIKGNLAKEKTMKAGRISSIRSSGFTLVEIMVVVLILGVILVVAVPSFRRIRQDSFISEFADTLETIRGAFDEYAVIHRGYPGDTTAGVEPAGMSSFLPKRLNWTEETPLGGKWKWEGGGITNGLGFQFGVSVLGSPSPPGVFEQVDVRIDDGNLSTGNFRRIPGTIAVTPRYSYIIQTEQNDPWGVAQ